MEPLIVGLCAFTAFLCAALLLRAYFRQQIKLFLWTGLYFLLLTLNTGLHMVAQHLLTASSLRTVRLIISMVGMLFLIYGLIFESEEETEL